jgi:hypothetical protein
MRTRLSAKSRSILSVPALLLLLVAFNAESLHAGADTTDSSARPQQIARDTGHGDLFILGIKLTDVLLLTLTAAALILTWAITAYQWRLTRKQNAVQLHGEYYGVEHYANVVAAVVQVRLKWRFLPDTVQRSAYQDLVTAGWAPDVLKTGEDAGLIKFRLYVRQTDRTNADLMYEHFHAPASMSGLTEHQAVAALLHFWSRVAGLLQAKAVDRHLAREFFAPAYEYNRQFFACLRERVEASLSRSDPRPAWLGHTRALERFFGRAPAAQLLTEAAEPAPRDRG